MKQGLFYGKSAVKSGFRSQKKSSIIYVFFGFLDLVMKWAPSGQKRVLTPQFCIILQMQLLGYVENIPYMRKIAQNGKKTTPKRPKT